MKTPKPVKAIFRRCNNSHLEHPPYVLLRLTNMEHLSAPPVPASIKLNKYCVGDLVPAWAVDYFCNAPRIDVTIIDTKD